MKVMLEQRYQNNKSLIGEKRTKSILPINGRVYFKCEVVSIKNNRIFKTVEVGENHGNMKYFDVLKMGALDNALYKHIQSGGVSGARVNKILDYWIKYFNREVTVKRVRVPPKTVRVEVPAKIRVVKEKSIDLVRVRSYTRGDGVKVRGHVRPVRRVREVEEVVRRGYSYDRKIGRGSYESKVFFKGDEVLSTGYKRRSVSSLNKGLYDINRSKNEARFVDRI